MRQFAGEEQLDYIDHWPIWPATDEELVDYLAENKSAPNEAGHQLWFEFLEGNFVVE